MAGALPIRQHLLIMSDYFDDGSGMKIVTSQATFDKMLQGLSQLAKVEVLVGFPEDTTQRTEDSLDQSVTNASLGYIHDQGAPEANIPARPFMLPGMAAAQDAITDKLVQTMKAVSQNRGVSVIERGLTQAGLLAKLSIQNTINEGIPPPLAPATIRGRARARQTTTRRASELQYMHLQGQGIDEDFLQGALGIKPLVNTGELRNAVNYVIRPRDKRR